jgi:cell division transport system permease protein
MVRSRQAALLDKVYFCTAGARGCKAVIRRRRSGRVRLWLAKDERVKKFTFCVRGRGARGHAEAVSRAGGEPDVQPLPPAFEVVPRDAEYTDDIKRDLLTAGPGGTKLAGIESVKDGGAKSRRVIKVGSIIEAVFLVGLIVLLIASTLLIANTIRLSIFARRREIEVMKLVGATNWFVRGPFMIEGLICGLIGSVAAVILLVIGRELVLPSLPQVTATADVKALAFELIALVILGAGLLLGALGSALTVHRFLRV